MSPSAVSEKQQPSIVDSTIKTIKQKLSSSSSSNDNNKKDYQYEHLTNVQIINQKPLGNRIRNFKDYKPNIGPRGDWQDYKTAYDKSINDPDTYFRDLAVENLHWFKPFDQTFIKDPATQLPSFENNAWFINGQLNACYNCVDKHAFSTPDKVAILYEPDDPNDSPIKLTYKQLLEEVSRVAQVLKISMGVTKGDTVAVYMPMIPQAIITLLAIVRIGAIHSVIFAGFSSHSLRDRIIDSHCKCVITSDESLRGGKIIQTKKIVDEAIKDLDFVSNVLVYNRTGNKSVPFNATRDLNWDSEVVKYKTYYPCEPVDSEHPLFLLYTSGSTGTPKGVQHSTAGYLINALLSMKYTFDVHPEDIFFTAGDIGWITGHTYVVYGPLLTGCTTVVFEGTPTFPNCSRYWDIIDKHQITQFYVAPTALRLLKRAGNQFIEGFSLKSLRCLGSVGEPIAAEVWDWYSEQIGKNEIPIVDTYWQTESGSHLITPLAGGVTPMKPGSASFPFIGIEPVILDPTTGQEINDEHAEGVLAIKRAWPSFARTIWKNHDRYLDTYLKPYPGYYFTGDGAARDKDGYIWILGRVDDVVNVSGHRLSTAEIESALIEDSLVAETAVVGFNDDLTGQAVAAFVVLKSKSTWSNASEKELQETKKHLILTVRTDIGPFAAPKLIVLVDDLPKTRSGKIMRRILRKILAGEADQLGDITTLSNPDVVQHLIDSVKL